MILKQIINIISFIKNVLIIMKYNISNEISVTSKVFRGTQLYNCSIGKYCYVGSYGKYLICEIGNYSCIASLCQIGGMEHSYWEYSKI